VFYDGKHYWPSDGFHRYFAIKKAFPSKLIVEAEVYIGTKRDAILDSLAANAVHGLQRTPEDKRNAVKRMLEDSEWSQWSDGEIARRAKVTQPFVSKLRREQVAASQ